MKFLANNILLFFGINWLIFDFVKNYDDEIEVFYVPIKNISNIIDPKIFGIILIFSRKKVVFMKILIKFKHYFCEVTILS